MSSWGDWTSIAGDIFGIWSDWSAGEKAEDLADKQAERERQKASSNAKLSLYDAGVMEQEARESFRSMHRDLQLHFQMGDELLGQQKVKTAKSGVSVSEGTPVDVMRDTKYKLKSDAELIKYDGMKAVKRSKQMADRYRMLADAGLRDSATYANLIEDSGRNKRDRYRWDMVSRGLESLGDIFE
jgi:hypothetical protein